MIDPSLLPLLRDPRRSLRVYGRVSSQAAKSASDVLAPYDPATVTRRMQQDILSYWADPPKDRMGRTLWFCLLGYRQGGKSLAAESGAYVVTSSASTWRHLCYADTPNRSKELLGRINLLHDNWDIESEAEGRPRLRFERKYDNEAWQATFSPVQVGKDRLSDRVMRTQHTGQDPIGAAWDSVHGSEEDFAGDDAAKFWSGLQPGLITRHHSLVIRESTPNPGTITPSVGFYRGFYFNAKARRADDSEMSRWFAKFYPFWDGVRHALPYDERWPLELEELRLLDRYGKDGLRPEHLMFRRSVLKSDEEIRRNPETFGIWYPFCDQTCWPTIQGTTFTNAHLARNLGQPHLVPWEPVDNCMWYPGRRKPAGEPDPEASYIMGVDPNGFGGKDHGAAEIREVWDDEQREVCSFAGGRKEGVNPETLGNWIIQTSQRFRDAGARIRVVVESNGVGAGVIAIIKSAPGVDLYYTEPDKPGVPASGKTKQEALVAHLDALLDDLWLQDQHKVEQHTDYRNDKAAEETDIQLQLAGGNPSRGRRRKDHWDKVSASLWTSWGVAHGVVRRPSVPIVVPPRTKPWPATESEWADFEARNAPKEYGGGDPPTYEQLP